MSTDVLVLPTLLADVIIPIVADIAAVDRVSLVYLRCTTVADDAISRDLTRGRGLFQLDYEFLELMVASFGVVKVAGCAQVKVSSVADGAVVDFFADGESARASVAGDVALSVADGRGACVLAGFDVPHSSYEFFLVKFAIFVDIDNLPDIGESSGVETAFE